MFFQRKYHLKQKDLITEIFLLSYSTELTYVQIVKSIFHA